MRYKSFVIWAIGIFITWLVSGYLMTLFWGISGRGQAGDMFGGINSLFSGLAFAGIIFTIVIQREELKLQREELKLQRDEVAKSRQELAGQKEQMVIQRFENTYFNLLSAQNEIANSVSFNEFRGRMTFYKLYNIFEIRFGIAESEQEAFDSVFNDHHSILQHYCINVVTIISFVNTRKELTALDKLTYIGFLKSQITSYELIFLYYYGTREQHLLILFKEYDFFRDLKTNLLLDKNRNRDILESLYLSGD